MPIVELKICERCGAEERGDDKGIRWDSCHGHIVLSFKGVGGIQREYNYKVICYHCARAIEEHLLKFLSPSEGA